MPKASSTSSTSSKKSPYGHGSFTVGMRVHIPFYDAQHARCYGVVIGIDASNPRRPFLVRCGRRPKIVLRCAAESLTAAAV